ncbi:achaete-scute complex protein T3-like [Anticarsia gemmatalis]|uniref:achaete-scute complex protein T3-like n=1 Tax=Anticarsia gemmatalis TaxID=129554 RepID=UPI003F76523B
MPMAAIHSYQNLGVDQKLTHLQAQAPRRLAPAPVDANRCKKRSYLHQPYPTQPASVARRNARERNRVKQVNNGFAALRQHIPSAVAAALAGGRGSSRKLSKVDTLRLAVEYIKSLKKLLEDSEEGCETQSGLSYNNSSSGGPHTPPLSEESHSPAPSLVSESSAGPSCHDAYESYEPMSPEDEELLDVISWWQQQ